MDDLNYWFVVTLGENKYCRKKGDYVVGKMTGRHIKIVKNPTFLLQAKQVYSVYLQTFDAQENP